MPAAGLRRALLAACLLCSLLAPSGATGATPAEIAATVASGASWLRSKQVQSGAIGGFNGDWATTTLAAAGINAADLRGAGAVRSLQDFWQLEYGGPEWGQLPSPVGPGQIGKAALIASSAGLQPTRITAEVNLAADLASTYDWSDGSFAGSTATNALGFALLAMPGLGLPEAISGRATATILANQHSDGGWTYMNGGSTPGDTDMTGAALAMVCSNGIPAADPRVRAGIEFLHERLDPASGAIESDTPGTPAQNAPTHAWALTGLLACGEDPQGPGWTTALGKNPLDFALGLRVASGPQIGAIRYEPGSTATDPNNVNATEALVRALAGNLFSAAPPPRADPTRAAIRPAPAVAEGTPVPVALTIEDGSSPARMCAVRVRSGTPLVEALAAARTSSAPAGCVGALGADGPWVTVLNGAGPADPAGGWVASTPGTAEHRAGPDPVGFGDVVRLRLVDAPLPGGLAATPRRVAFGTVAVGTAASAELQIGAAFAPVGIDAVRIEGSGAFALEAGDCEGRTLAAGQSCRLKVRFLPAAAGELGATLRVVAPGADRTAIDVPLVGSALAQAPALHPRRPRIRVRRGVRRLGRGRTATIAILVCPAGGTCTVRAPRRVTVSAAGSRHAVLVLAPRRIAAGEHRPLRVRLRRASATRLAGRRVTVNVGVRLLGPGGRRAVRARSVLLVERRAVPHRRSRSRR